jgi:hypothetical protein
MSARQFDVSPTRDRFVPLQLSPATPLSLTAAAVRVRRNGIEFHHSQPVAPWTEVEVRMNAGGGSEEFSCTGVVVSCSGTARTGFHVSMVLLGLPPGSQRHLSALAHSQLS